jgi:uncharacterized membrane protein YkoI
MRKILTAVFLLVFSAFPILASARPSSLSTDARHQLDYPSMAKVSLLKAVARAEKALAGSRATSVYLLLDKEDKTLKWYVWVRRQDGGESKVTVDPLNGKVLDVAEEAGK